MAQQTADSLAFYNFLDALQDCTLKTASALEGCDDSYVQVAKLSRWFQSSAILGTSETTQAKLLLEYAQRNWDEHSHTFLSTKDLFEGESRCVTVFSILLKLGWGDFVLLFRNSDMVDSALPIDLLTLRYKLKRMAKLPGQPRQLDDPERLAAEFNNAQWQFCPVVFKLGKYYDSLNKRQILPICKKEIINDKGGTASLWQIEVLEEFVDKDLRNAVKTSRYVDPKDKLGPRYQFAWKIFREGKKDVSHNEREAFTALESNGHVVRYLGGFNHFRTTQASPPEQGLATKATYNILLEFGDFDLDEFFAERLPPVLEEEVTAFWKSIFEIAEAVRGIHNFKMEDAGIVKEYWGWHADIKPDNILEIKGRFKLSDPGFAIFKSKRAGNVNVEPTAKLKGGTHTFGAPECSSGNNDHDEVLQTIDIWSLGCVFSITATWVILGYQGVRQLARLRRNAIQAHMQNTHSHDQALSLKHTDYFHDGTGVLPEILDWHRFLRSATRKTDNVTGQVLDLVDQFMLVQDPIKRIKAANLCEELSRILSSQASTTTVPKSIAQFLSDIDEDIPLHSPLPGWPAIPSSTPDRQHRKNMHLYVPLLKTTHRSYSRSLSTSKPLLPPLFGNVADEDENIHKEITHAASSQRLAGERSTKRHSPRYQGHDGKVSNESILSTSLYPNSTTRRGSAISSRSIPITDRPKAQNMFQARGELSRREKEKGAKSKFLEVARIKEKPKDNVLSGYYENRDIKFIVDNSWSMSDYWDQLEYLLEVLVDKASGLDEDGIDLAFTHGNVQAENVKGRAKIMQKIRDPQAVPKKENKSDVSIRLQDILTDYVRIAADRKKKGLRQKKLNIIFLTDGIWQYTFRKERVNECIVNAANELHSGLRVPINGRPLSIQFVQFGNDPDATLRLQRLDDDLKYDGVPDIIDTERCDGDVNKMMLGSFVEAYDDLNVIQEPEDRPSSSSYTYEAYPEPGSMDRMNTFNTFQSGQPRSPDSPENRPFSSTFGYKPQFDFGSPGRTNDRGSFQEAQSRYPEGSETRRQTSQMGGDGPSPPQVPRRSSMRRLEEWPGAWKEMTGS